MTTSWTGDAMTFYGWGFVAGISRGRDLTETEMAARWRFVFHAVQRQASGKSPTDLTESRRRHQLEAWQRVQAEARPWPPETGPLCPHALFGQPQQRRVSA